MVEPRPFPFARLPRFRRDDVVSLRRAARRLPLGALARSSAAVQSMLGVALSIEPLPIEHCPEGELRACLSDPLCAAILEPAAPLRGATIALEIEPRLAAVVIDRVLGGTGQGAPLDPGALGDVEKGVLAYALARALAASGGALRLVTIVTSPIALVLALGEGASMCWPARARLGADGGIVRAWLPERALDRADPSPIPEPHTASLGAIAVEVVITSGRATLSGADVAALSPGDVIVLDESLARRDGAGLRGEVRASVRGGGTRWRCAIEGSRLVVVAIEAGKARARALGEKERAMEDEEQRAAALLRAAGDAPIELHVELARFEMPLAELAALRPGEVLATGRAIGERVTLRAGDRAVALGELVEIEGEIGVRILSLGA